MHLQSEREDSRQAESSAQAPRTLKEFVGKAGEKQREESLQTEEQ